MRMSASESHDLRRPPLLSRIGQNRDVGLRRGFNVDLVQEEFVLLLSAGNADALHQLLVLREPFRREADATVPMYLLEKHHATEPSTSVATAMLLLTDRRWCDGASRLVQRIEEAGFVAPDELDLLANAFVAADAYVLWRVPDEWLGTLVVEVEMDTADDAGAAPDDPGDDDAPVVVRREIFPPVRRWAAERLVRRGLMSWSHVYARARALDSRGGAALLAGLLDAADALAGPVRRLLVDVAVGWPHKDVRKAGLTLLAARDGVQTAHDRAMRDPNAQIRAWAPSLLDDAPEARVGGPGSAIDPASRQVGRQRSLF